MRWSRVMFTSREAAWALAASWMGVIFATIPIARTLQRLIEPRAGAHIYLVSAILVGSLGILATLARMIRVPQPRLVRRLVGLGGLGVLSIWVLHRQLQTAAEAIHFVEYGFLSFLLFRAWRQDVRDPLVYPICALNLALVAWLDEFLQWLTAERFWDFRDIRLNLLAGLILLAFIAGVIVPAGIRGPVARASVRRLGYLTWALLLALGLSVSATPRRVDALAVRVPFLGFLYNNESTMIEYGHRHVDPAIGTFFSRLTLSELARHDRERGAAAGRCLKEERDQAPLRKHREIFPASEDPFLHEAGARLARRDHYYNTAWQYRESDPARLAWHLTVAHRENQILAQYFPVTLAAAGARWPAERGEQCAAQADLTVPYASDVAGHLVTKVTEGQLWGMFLALAALTGWGYVRWGRERPVPA